MAVLLMNGVPASTALRDVATVTGVSPQLVSALQNA